MQNHLEREPHDIVTTRSVYVLVHYSICASLHETHVYISRVNSYPCIAHTVNKNEAGKLGLHYLFCPTTATNEHSNCVNSEPHLCLGQTFTRRKFVFSSCVQIECI